MIRRILTIIELPNHLYSCTEDKIRKHGSLTESLAIFLDQVGYPGLALFCSCRCSSSPDVSHVASRWDPFRRKIAYLPLQVVGVLGPTSRQLIARCVDGLGVVVRMKDVCGASNVASLHAWFGSRENVYLFG